MCNHGLQDDMGLENKGSTNSSIRTTVSVSRYIGSSPLGWNLKCHHCVVFSARIPLRLTGMVRPVRIIAIGPHGYGQVWSHYCLWPTQGIGRRAAFCASSPSRERSGSTRCLSCPSGRPLRKAGMALQLLDFCSKVFFCFRTAKTWICFLGEIGNLTQILDFCGGELLD